MFVRCYDYTMNIIHKKKLHLYIKVRKNGALWIAVLVAVLAILGIGLLKFHPSNPQALFFQDILKSTPNFYDQQVKVLGASPAKNDINPGCIQTYQGYPPGQKSPSHLYPYHCSINIADKTFVAPESSDKGYAAIQQFVHIANSEGFVSKEGITRNDDGISYQGNREYGGKAECYVEVVYFYAVAAKPGINEASPASYAYQLNCGGDTYPYIPPGYPIYSESSGFGH